MSTTVDDSGPRFARSLDEVAQRLNAPYSFVTQLRDDEQCPFLVKAPYDIEAILKWLTRNAELDIDPHSESGRRKIEMEIEKLRRDRSLWSKDKWFWLFAITAGFTVSKELRGWMDWLIRLHAENRKAGYGERVPLRVALPPSVGGVCYFSGDAAYDASMNLVGLVQIVGMLADWMQMNPTPDRNIGTNQWHEFREERHIIVVFDYDDSSEVPRLTVKKTYNLGQHPHNLPDDLLRRLGIQNRRRSGSSDSLP